MECSATFLDHFDAVLFNFSELLALETAKFMDVQICQFILLR